MRQGRQGRQGEYDVPIKVVGKVGLILDAFRRVGAEMHLQQIASSTGLELSTASRIVTSLVGIGLLRYDPVQRLYTPGLIFLELSRSVLNRFSFRELAHREMIALAAETGWQCYLAVPDEDSDQHIIYIDVVSARADHPESSEVGQRRTMHSTATGKVFLAYRRTPLDRLVLEPRTSFTHTDSRKLRDELDTVVAQGFAIAVNEEQLDVCGAAAPIFDANGEVVASFGVSTVEAGFETTRDQIVTAALAKARGITSAMRLSGSAALSAMPARPPIGPDAAMPA
jgi:IclR family KDG regulon transcriptional repressor